MVNLENLNYGALYSFEPDYMKHVLEDEPEYEHEDSGASMLDMSESNWSGVLLILVILLFGGLAYSMTRSVTRDGITKLSGVQLAHAKHHWL